MPYGQPGQYGAPPQQQWPPPPPQYGQYGAPGFYGQQPAARTDLATWSQRAVGGVIDYVLPSIVAYVLIFLFAAIFSTTLATLLSYVVNLGLLAFVLWNSYRGGVTGQTIGRRYAKVRLIKEETGEPIGGGMGIARYFCHIIEFGIGFLAPLFTPKKQTFADMVLGTIVVKTDG